MSKWLWEVIALVIVVQLAGMAEVKRMGIAMFCVLPAVSSGFSALERSLFLENSFIVYKSAAEKRAPCCDSLSIFDSGSKRNLITLSSSNYESLLEGVHASRSMGWQNMNHPSTRHCICLEHSNDCWSFPKITKVNYDSGWKHWSMGGRIEDFDVHKYICPLSGSGSLSSFKGSVGAFTSILSGLLHQAQLNRKQTKLQGLL